MDRWMGVGLSSRSRPERKPRRDAKEHEYMRSVGRTADLRGFFGRRWRRGETTKEHELARMDSKEKENRRFSRINADFLDSGTRAARPFPNLRKSVSICGSFPGIIAGKRSGSCPSFVFLRVHSWFSGGDGLERGTADFRGLARIFWIREPGRPGHFLICENLCPSAVPFPGLSPESALDLALHSCSFASIRGSQVGMDWNEEPQIYADSLDSGTRTALSFPICEDPCQSAVSPKGSTREAPTLALIRGGSRPFVVFLFFRVRGWDRRV